MRNDPPSPALDAPPEGMRGGVGTAASRRLAVVWAADQPLTTITVRYERYLAGFRALGWEAFAVCSEKAASGFSGALVRVPDQGCLRDQDFWRSLRLDAAVLITWLTLPDVVAALKAACPWVVSVADSDGLVGVRVFPGATFDRSVRQHTRLLDRIRAAKFWVQRYLAPSEVYDQPLLESAERADLIAVCSPNAKNHLGRFFAFHRRQDLAARVAVIPYPVDDCFRDREVMRRRGRRLVAVGRWDDPQKNAPLLAAAVRRVLAVDPEIGFDLVGPGGSRAFAELCRRHPRVVYHDRQPPAAVAELLQNSRSLLLSSRWESGPIVANEALSLGCTLVGPARIPTIEAYCRSGRYGTACRGGSPKALAGAVLDEMQAWDDGKRDSVAIAAAWRTRFDPKAVCRQLLEPCNMSWD